MDMPNDCAINTLNPTLPVSMFKKNPLLTNKGVIRKFPGNRSKPLRVQSQFENEKESNIPTERSPIPVKCTKSALGKLRIFGRIFS